MNENEESIFDKNNNKASKSAKMLSLFKSQWHVGRCDPELSRPAYSI